MIRTRALLALFAAAALTAPAGSARGEGQAEDDRRVARVLGAIAIDRVRESAAHDTAFDLGVSAPSGGSGHEPFTLRTSSRDTETPDLRTLIGSGEHWRLIRFDAVAHAPRLQAKLTAYGHGAYLPSDVAGSTSPGDDPVALGLTAEVGDLAFGAEYRSLAKRHPRLVLNGARDEAGTEVWIARRIGPLRLRVGQAELSDNVDDNPALPRTARVETSVGAELVPWAGSTIGLAYGTRESERTRVAVDAVEDAPERRTDHWLTASAYHDGGWWGAGMSSTYSLGNDAGHRDRDSSALYQDASVWLRVVEALTITGAASTGHERYRWAGLTAERGSTWVTLAYAPTHHPWHAWALIGGSFAANSDRAVDGRAFSVGAGLGWDLHRGPKDRSTVSVEVGHDRYLDRVVPGHSSSSFHALLLLTIAAR